MASILTIIYIRISYRLILILLRFGRSLWGLYALGYESNQPKALAMRKIESQMVHAVKNNQDWQGANTTVEYNYPISVVKLHGHKIAEIGDGFIKLFDGGHQTNTTKSRLNAILNGCGLPGEKVFAKQFSWFVSINGNGIYSVPFFSGMRLN